jgi:Uma2 family endonuclease
MLQLQWTQPPNDYPTSDGKPMAENDIHRDLMFQLIKTIEHRYRDRQDVYVSGNILWFYREGDRRRHVSPDVLVCFGIPKARRVNYLQWDEGHAPQVVVELTSSSTRREDFGRKYRLYEELGVQELYIFDPPLYKLLRGRKPSPKASGKPRLHSFRRVGSSFAAGPIEQTPGKVEELHGPDLRAYSPLLDLELLVLDGELRLRDPHTLEVLLDPTERADAAEKTAKKEAARALQEAHRAEKEAARAEAAERELAELRKLLGTRPERAPD